MRGVHDVCHGVPCSVPTSRTVMMEGKRSWATLPDRIYLGQMRVPPGTYDVELRHIGIYGGVVATQVIHGVAVDERGKRFVSARVLQ